MGWDIHLKCYLSKPIPVGGIPVGWEFMGVMGVVEVRNGETRSFMRLPYGIRIGGKMAKLIMTRGLPGSGKTYWATQQDGFTIVCKDDIRAGLEQTGWKWTKDGEKDVLRIQTDQILTLLRNGKNVIAADTNFGKHEARLSNLAKQAKADFAVRDFTEVPLEVCLERNRNREKPIPDEFILRQYKDYIEPFLKIEKVEWVEGLPTCVICDLDGTLAIHVARGPYDEEKCETDALNRNVAEVLDALHEAGHQIIFLSGRKDRVREQTERWLRLHAYGPWLDQPLLMRKSEDNRNDAVVKNEIFDEHIRGKYNVVCVLDDRDRVVKRWREMGLVCFQVNYGNF